MLNFKRYTSKTSNYIHTKSFEQILPRKKFQNLCVQLHTTDSAANWGMLKFNLYI